LANSIAALVRHEKVGARHRERDRKIQSSDEVGPGDRRRSQSTQSLPFACDYCGAFLVFAFGCGMEKRLGLRATAVARLGRSLALLWTELCPTRSFA
jgi:hypothetical protein